MNLLNEIRDRLCYCFENSVAVHSHDQECESEGHEYAKREHRQGSPKTFEDEFPVLVRNDAAVYSSGGLFENVVSCRRNPARDDAVVAYDERAVVM